MPTTCTCCNVPLAEPKRVRLTKWQRWFRELSPGDQVLIQFPWQDKTRPGGRRVVATVGRTLSQTGQIFRYRRIDGSRSSQLLQTWSGNPYAHVMPLGHATTYSAKRGFVVVKEKTKAAAKARRNRGCKTRKLRRATA